MSKVLIIGSGGREHALAWKFSRSPQVDRVYVATGNPGMEEIAERVDILPSDFNALVNFAKSECISLTVVGPEVPLLDGIADFFIDNGLKIFAPRANAAIIEGSKTFAKELMSKYNIPTARYNTFSDYNEALNTLKNMRAPYVIKADGLAQGKGVVILDTVDEAETTLYDIMINKCFGEAGDKVLIEEFLYGTEYTLMAFVHGDNVIPLIPAKDYKRAHDGDNGPNTGGMGAYAPVPQLGEADISLAIDSILLPVAKAMVKEGRSFTGVLYAGLIATADGSKVIEFNARFGDPETEVLMPLMDSDIYTVLIDLLNGKKPIITWSEGHALGVVLASRGYPSRYSTGFKIGGLNDLEKDTLVFHCGTDRRANEIETKGGRVLFVARKAGNLYEAGEAVYNEINKIKCDNLYYRTDIGRVI